MKQDTVIIRDAKITPIKIGQFVTLYTRETDKSPIRPYDSTDSIDYVIVNVRSGSQSGQFIFPKNILLEKDVFSRNSVGGKRALRVYPPWDQPDNAQAKKTQAWQVNYFKNCP